MLGCMLGMLVAAGCSKTSLFDEHGGGGHGNADGGGGDDGGGVVPATCTAPCLGDAAADFNGTAGGTGSHWRYLDDHRDRTWTAMAVTSATSIGADPGNHITTCAAHPEAAACKALPGALLVTSTGATSPGDPALEFTAASDQVVQLSVHAFVATGGDQQIRIYRNSREDVLYTGAAVVGTKLDQAVTFDALAGDRFLVAVAPTAQGATDVGLQVFVSPTGAAFPSACQVAVSFSAAAGNTVANACGGGAFTHSLFEGAMDTAPVLAAGPYPELGTAGDFTQNNYLHGTGIVDKSHDFTLQLWVKHRMFFEDIYDAWLFSDLDLDAATGGGIALAIADVNPPVLEMKTCLAESCTSASFRDIAYPSDGSWQFVRLVQTGDTVNLCLNGKRQASMPAPAGSLKSTFSPWLGADQRWSPQGAYLDGELDDVRVLTGALPCE